MEIYYYENDSPSQFAKTKVLELAFIKWKKNLSLVSEGKPRFGDSNHYFNISHSNNKVVIALADFEVGIDIEEIRSFNPKLINRFFTDSEKEFCVKEGYTSKAFFTIWTKKEAYAKYTGDGLKDIFKKKDVSSHDVFIDTFEYDGCIISICCKEPTKFDFFSNKK